jgi:hypothetical protein
VITYYCKVVVGPEAQLCSVRGVGSESRDVDVWHDTVSVRRGSGTSTDDPGAWQNLVRPDPRVRQRISDRCDPVYPSGPDWFFKWMLKLIHSFSDDTQKRIRVKTCRSCRLSVRTLDNSWVVLLRLCGWPGSGPPPGMICWNFDGNP